VRFRIQTITIVSKRLDNADWEGMIDPVFKYKSRWPICFLYWLETLKSTWATVVLKTCKEYKLSTEILKRYANTINLQDKSFQTHKVSVHCNYSNISESHSLLVRDSVETCGSKAKALTDIMNINSAYIANWLVKLRFDGTVQHLMEFSPPCKIIYALVSRKNNVKCNCEILWLLTNR